MALYSEVRLLDNTKQFKMIFHVLALQRTIPDILEYDGHALQKKWKKLSTT